VLTYHQTKNKEQRTKNKEQRTTNNESLQESMLSNKIKEQITRAIRPLEPEKIILFGSYAYGLENSESDIDLLLIKELSEDKIKEYRIKVRKKLWEQFKGQGLSFDILVDSNNRIQKRIALGDLFYSEIINKGKIIYA
jgi:uncharacterized protein